MTREADIRDGLRAASPTREELRRRLLALVLAAVLVWYTVVVPAGAYAKNSPAQAPDDEGRDGEVRGREGEVSGRGGGARADSRARAVAVVNDGFTSGPGAVEAARGSVEDLDWPEYIYPD